MKTAVIFAFVYFVLVKSQEVIDELQRKDTQKSLITQVRQQQQQTQGQQTVYRYRDSKIGNNKRQNKRAIYGGYDLNNPRSFATSGYNPYLGYNGYNSNNNLITPTIGYNPAFTTYPTSSIGYNPATPVVNAPWYSGLGYSGNYNRYNPYNPYTTKVVGLNDNGGYNSYNYGGYYNNRLNGYRGYNGYSTGTGYTYGPGISGYNY